MVKTIQIRRIYDYDNWFNITYEDERIPDYTVIGKVYEILDDNLDYLKETDPHNYFYFRINSKDHLIIAETKTCNCMKKRHYHYKENDTEIIFEIFNNKKI